MRIWEVPAVHSRENRTLDYPEMGLDRYQLDWRMATPRIQSSPALKLQTLNTSVQTQQIYRAPYTIS